MLTKVYDGETAPSEIRDRCRILSDKLKEYFIGSGQDYSFRSLMEGRSDFFPFLEAGIPAGAVATGAEGIKTEEERDTYKGLANASYDTCYHQYCDKLANVDPDVLYKVMTFLTVDASSRMLCCRLLRLSPQFGGNIL